jgi:hypothetical protein
MPLDMTQIQTSNLAGAKTLTEVLLPQQKDAQIVDPGKLERGISIALGIVMGIMFFGLGIYMLWTFIKGSGTGTTVAGAAAADAPTTWYTNIKVLAPFLVVLIIGIISGAVITTLTAKKA